MNPFETILVPLDLGPQTATVRTAAALAAAFKSTVWLLHVIEEVDAPSEELTSFYEKLETRAWEHLAKAAAPLRAAGVPHKTEVIYGKRAPEIVGFADDKKVDLVILESHRISPSDTESRFMTISHQVAIAGSTSVLLVRSS